MWFSTARVPDYSFPWPLGPLARPLPPPWNLPLLKYSYSRQVRDAQLCLSGPFSICIVSLLTSTLFWLKYMVFCSIVVTRSFVSWRVALITIYNIALGKWILFSNHSLPNARWNTAFVSWEHCINVSWPTAAPQPNDIWFKVHVTASSFK